MSERVNDPTAAIFPGVEGDRSEWGQCGCWTCVQDQPSTRGGFFMPFIVCPECGNKRCPRAMHHDRECSGSNEPGQPGSRFAAATQPTDTNQAAVSAADESEA